nr:TetR/AcrR family transcriptional regulator [Hyphomonas sp. Mor2]
MRKNAKQARARRTIEIILEATTQLLETQNVDQVSTNHIAERAGVSIGTLYQYFPNKTAIFLALAERDIEARFQVVANALTASARSGTVDPVRTLTRAFIATFAGSPRNASLVKVIMSTRAQAGRESLPVDRIASLLTETAGAIGPMRKMTRVSAFVLTRAVLWTILTATLDAPELLEEAEFEDEIVLLTHSLLNPGARNVLSTQD